MALFRKSSTQELPELGEMHDFNLGLTPDSKNDFIDQLAGYDQKEVKRLSGLSDNELVAEMRNLDSNDRVTDELGRLDAGKVLGRVFIFHMGKDELSQIVSNSSNAGVGVYDSHRSSFGLVPERIEELELRQKVKNITNPVARRKTWKEIIILNQRANGLEEALSEIIPDENQQKVHETHGGQLFLNLLAGINHCRMFDAVEWHDLAVKGGHPHNALVSQHYLELALQRLGNPNYELVPLKKYFGTDTYAVSEWVVEYDPIEACFDALTKTLYGDAESTRLVDAYNVRKSSSNVDHFVMDEKIDGILSRVKKLVQKLYHGGELDSEEQSAVSFYEKMIVDEENVESPEVQRRFNKWWTKKMDYCDPKYHYETDYTEQKALMFSCWQREIKNLEEEFAPIGPGERRTLTERVRVRIAKDYQVLKAYHGYAKLFSDLSKIRDDRFEAEKEISGSAGRVRVDVRLEHLLFRGFNERGDPKFSIIDMYHLGRGEFEYKARITGYDLTVPKQSLAP